jgi:hypothetical protein
MTTIGKETHVEATSNKLRPNLVRETVTTVFEYAAPTFQVNDNAITEGLIGLEHFAGQIALPPDVQSKVEQMELLAKAVAEERQMQEKMARDLIEREAQLAEDTAKFAANKKRSQAMKRNAKANEAPRKKRKYTRR